MKRQVATDHEAQRQARLERKRTVFKQLAREVVQGNARWNMDDASELETRSVDSGVHPSVAAMQFVRDALSDYDIPSVKLRYSGMKRMGTGQLGDTGFQDGVITVQAELASLSGVKQYVDVPIIVRAGKMVYPEVMLHNGSPRVMAQSTFDDLIEQASIYELEPERKNMFVPPSDGPAGVGRMRVRTQESWLRAAQLGTSEAPSHLDPAERDRSAHLQPGAVVRTANELHVVNRGGGKTHVPAGSKGTIIRDMFGDDYCYYVELEKFGKAPICRKDLK